MTKQAMGQLADELSGQGYVTKVTDPSDRRATVVNFTDRGGNFAGCACGEAEIEAEYVAILGVGRWVGLNEALELLIGRREEND
ncbi:MAG: winged helix DNA-binding protein [Chloroflexia bacterium]